MGSPFSKYMSQEKIDEIYSVYPEKEPDNVLFEGTREECLEFIREHNYSDSFRVGYLRIGNGNCPYDSNCSSSPGANTENE